MLARITFTAVSLISSLFITPHSPERVSVPVSAPQIRFVAHHPTHLVTEAVLQAWGRVAICEEGGWKNSVDGPTYFGSIGWLWSTWQMFRRHDFPVNMYYASAQQQSWAGQRFVAYYHMAIPDENGCGSGY